MDRHQHDGFHRARVVARRRQRDALEERVDRLGLGALLVEVRGDRDELGEVVEPIARLGGFVGLELRAEAAAIDDLNDDLGDRGTTGDHGLQALDQLDERLELLARLRSDAGDLTARRELRGVEHAAITRARRGTQPIDGGLTEPARGHVDHPLERRIRGRIADQPEIADHVLDLFALEKRERTDDLRGNARRAQVLLEHPRLRIGAIQDRDLARRPLDRSRSDRHLPDRSTAPCRADRGCGR